MQNLTIMIVDDHQLQLAAMGVQLKHLGITNLISCMSGKDAVEAINNRHVDIIFCDLIMPDMDGVELIKNLSECQYKGVLVILSGADENLISTVKHMSLKLGFSHVYEIKKPASHESIKKILDDKSIYEKILNSDKQKHVTLDDFKFALKNGEIKNHYQPQIDYATNQMSGVEALARWIHPKLGILYPNAFLPMMLEAELEYELYRVVLRNALYDLSKGLISCKVSINVTQKELEQQGFTDELLQLCREFGVEPKMLTIELTETGIYTDSVELVTNISRLRINGVGLAIDDFGTGNSSYLKLSQLPFTEIKIDRRFVSNCYQNEKKKSIIKSMCTLSKSMDVKLVSEGVEDSDTWALMQSYGVDVCQGYFTGKPVSVEVLNQIELD